MNQDQGNRELPSSNGDLGIHDEEASPFAVAAGSLIAAAADTADAFLEILIQERARRREIAKGQPAPTNQAEPKANTVSTPKQQIEIDDGEEDRIPVVTVKPNASGGATAAHDDLLAEDDNTVEVRVSSQGPRARKTEPHRQRARELALALLDTLVEQVGEYMEHSPAINRVIRIQVDNILNELATHPANLQPLIQAQAAAYFSYLQLHPEVVEPLIRQQANLYLDHLLQQSAQVDSLVEKIAGNYLARLQENPEQVEPFVRALASRYIAALQNDPTEVMPLVEQLGDNYIDYLREHPEAVQELIQGQSLNLAQEVMNEARERAATSDTVVELFARRLIGRPPREELPPPPPEVQALAERRPLVSVERSKKKRGKK